MSQQRARSLGLIGFLRFRLYFGFRVVVKFNQNTVRVSGVL